MSYGIPATIHTQLRETDVQANLSCGVMDDAQKRFSNLVVIALDVHPDVLKSRLLACGRKAQSDILKPLARPRCVLPAGLHLVELDNSGDLDTAA